MHRILIFGLLCILTIACQTTTNSEETSNDLKVSKTELPNSKTNSPIDVKKTVNALTMIQTVQKAVCSGKMNVNTLFHYELNGKSIKYYLDWNIGSLSKEDQAQYKVFRSKINCCTKEIVEHFKCEHMTPSS